MKKSNLHYLAGALEHRGNIVVDPLSVSLRTRGPLPKQLKRIFGGTCFRHGDKNWFKISGKKAEILLMRIWPFLRLDKKRVAKRLKIGRPKNERSPISPGLRN